MQHTHAFSLPASLSTNGFVKTNQIISQGFLSSRRTSLQKHQFLFQRRKRKEPEHISRGNAFSIKYEGLTKSNNFLKKKNKNRKQNGAVNTKKAPKGMPERGPKLAFQTLGLTRSSVCSSLHNGRGASTQSLTILQEKKKKRMVCAAFYHCHPPVWKNGESYAGKKTWARNALQNIF